jgi:hypothetical protein
MAGRSGSTKAKRTRSEPYAIIYCLLGPKRSLEAVRDTAAALGLHRPVRSTLTGWSAEYGWVKRAEAWDEEHTAATTAVALHDAIADDVRHAQIARRLVALAEAGALELLNTEGKPKEPLKATEIARLFDVGFKAERLISGKATETHTVLAGVWNLLAGDVVELYQRSRDATVAVLLPHVPEEMRLQLELDAAHAASAVFGPGMDNLIARQFASLGMAIPGTSTREDDDED